MIAAIRPLVEDEDAARVVAVLKNLLAGVDPL